MTLSTQRNNYTLVGHKSSAENDVKKLLVRAIALGMSKTESGLPMNLGLQ